MMEATFTAVRQSWIRRRLDVRAAALVLMAVAIGGPSAMAQRGGPALVEVKRVVEREVASGQTFVGTVMPTQRAIIGSAVDGRVIEFLVREGDRVEAEQPLARLLTNTIGLELEAAQAELELRKQQLAELENGTRPDELEQARARMEAARIAAEYLESDRQRLLALSRSRAASASELERAVSAAQEAQQRYAEAKAAYQLAVDGPRPEQIAQAKAQVAIQDALVRRLEDQIIKHTMVSRFAGYVTAEHTEVGQWAMRGDPVAEVVALDEVDVVAKVVEAHVPFIHVGDSVRVEVPALPNETFVGTVAAVVPQADLRSRTFPVKVRVRNRLTGTGGPLLKAGMLGRVTLATGAPQKAMLVPKDAIVLGGRTPMVWAIEEASIQSSSGDRRAASATAIPVQLGVAEGDLIQVIGALQPQQWIVTKGNERIPPAAPGQASPVTWLQSPEPASTPATQSQATQTQPTSEES